ncbi:hypothetical protein RU95_GL003860 [Enterococcus avium]|jgi:hypothetical protein|nr:hypothetical protein RU95_GL003860 [Enterococcus avium]
MVYDLKRELIFPMKNQFLNMKKDASFSSRFSGCREMVYGLKIELIFHGKNQFLNMKKE